MPEPITKETLLKLHRVLNNSTLFKYKTPSVAIEDDEGIVTLSDPDTGAPRMHLPREDFDALRAWKPKPVWRDTDPRIDIHKRAGIIIVRLVGSQLRGTEACTAWVETHHGYSVTTCFESPYHLIGEGADWPEDWQWTRAPEGS